MKLFVRVKTNAKVTHIEETDPTHFKVSVTVLPVDGKANSAVQKIIAKHLGVAPSLLTLTKGASSRDKVFEYN